MLHQYAAFVCRGPFDRRDPFDCRGPEYWMVDVEGDAPKFQPYPIHSQVAEDVKNRPAVSRTLDIERW